MVNGTPFIWHTYIHTWIRHGFVAEESQNDIWICWILNSHQCVYRHEKSRSNAWNHHVGWVEEILHHQFGMVETLWIHGMCTAVFNWWFGFRNHRNTLVLQRPSEIVVFGAVFGVCLHILRRYNWIHRPMKAWGWHSTHPTRVESFSHGELHCRRGRRRRSTAGESCFCFFFGRGKWWFIGHHGPTALKLQDLQVHWDWDEVFVAWWKTWGL